MKKSMGKYGDKMQPLFERVGRLNMVQRLLIGLCIFGLLIAGFVFFSFKPQYHKISLLDKKISTTEKELEIAKKKAAELPRLKEEWAKKQEEFKSVMDALPDKQEIPTLLGEISAAGRNAGLVFSRFSPQPEIFMDFYAEIPVAIMISGSYDRLKQFFGKVGEMSRVVNIRNITMSMDQKGTLNAKCTAVTYRFITPEEKTAKP